MHRFAILALVCLNLAPEAADLSLSAAPNPVIVGQTVTVQVRLANGPAALSAGQIRLDFDATRLAYVSTVKDSAASSLTINDTVVTINANGVLKMLLDYPAATASSGTLAQVTFTALSAGTATVTAVPGTQPYGCRLFDGAYAPVALTLPALATSIIIQPAAPSRTILMQVPAGHPWDCLDPAAIDFQAPAGGNQRLQLPKETSARLGLVPAGNT